MTSWSSPDGPTPSSPISTNICEPLGEPDEAEHEEMCLQRPFWLVARVHHLTVRHRSQPQKCLGHHEHQADQEQPQGSPEAHRVSSSARPFHIMPRRASNAPI